MALDLTSPSSPLFKRAGKIIHAFKALNTARKTTVPTEVNDVISEYNGTSLALRKAFTGLPTATSVWENTGDALGAALQFVFRDTICTMVKEDAQQETDSLTDAIDELIRQMVAATATIEKSSSTVSGPTAVGSPAGNGTLVCKTTLGNGREAEFAYTETLALECTSEAPARFRVRGQAAASKVSDQWPLGSGCDTNVPIVDPGSSETRLLNGSFETTDDHELNTPESWIRGSAFPATGTAAATLTAVQKQIVFLSGTLAATVYFILETGEGYATQPLAAGANASQIQDELRKLPGWSEATVVTSGSAPLIRHTITQTGVTSVTALAVSFSGVTGVNEQQSVSITGTPTTGTFALVCTKHDGTTTNVTVQWNSSAGALQTLLEGVYGAGNVACAGGALPGTPITVTWQGACANRNVETMTTASNTLDAGATPGVSAVTEGVGVSAIISLAAELGSFHKARSYKVLGNGSTVGPILLQKVELKPATMYAAFLAVKLSAATPSAGVLRFGLGMDNDVTVINNDQAVANLASVDLTAINDTAWRQQSGVFQTPTALPANVYFFLEISTAYQNGRHLFLDNLVLVEMTTLYAGGPSIAAFTGTTKWKLADKYTFGITNNRNGELHEWFNRLCDLDAMGKLLPTHTSPSLADGTFIS